MKKLIFSIIFTGAALTTMAQKSEVAEAKKQWDIYSFSLSGPEAAKQQRPASGQQPQRPKVERVDPNILKGNSDGIINNKDKDQIVSARARQEQMAARQQQQSAPKPPSSYVEKQLAALYIGLKHTDNAIVNEKSKIMPEAWAYRALFAASVAYVDTLNIENSLKHQAIAEEAIATAKTLKPGGSTEDDIKYANDIVNTAIAKRGSVAYNRKDFAAAYDQFVAATKRNPEDTAMYVNAAFMADQLQNYPGAIENYKKAISLNSKESLAHYAEMLRIMLNSQKDTASALALIKEASAKYPDELYFITNEAAIYIAQGDTKKSDELVDKLIAKDPKNPDYLRVKANGYFNAAYDMQDAIRKLEDAKKYKEADAMKGSKQDLLTKALPLYLKIETLVPKDAEIVRIIKQIYFSLGNEAKAAEYSKKQEAMGSN